MTCVSQITSSGPGQLGFSTVIGMGVILIGEEHDPLVAQPDTDITEEVGAGPECVTQGIVSTVAKALPEQGPAFLSPVLVQLQNTLRTWGETAFTGIGNSARSTMSSSEYAPGVP